MSGVVSVGAAVGAAAIAAEGVATVGLTMGTAMSIAGAVGATASAVGYFTKNKALQIGGAALGVVGGIGSMADSAGMFGAAGAAGDVSAVAGPAGGYTASMGADGLGEISGGGMSGVGSLFTGQGLGGDVISSITGMKAPADTLIGGGLPKPVTSPATSPTDQFGQTISQGGGEGTPLGNVDNPAAPGSFASRQSTPVTAPPATPAAAAAPVDTTPAVTPGPYQSTMGADATNPTIALKIGETQPKTALEDSSTWGDILAFMKANPALTLGAVSAAGNFLSGAFNPKNDAEVGALNAQAAHNTAQTGLINRQVANMGQPVPAATRTRTNTGTGRVDRVPV